jgi:hypothetical protein
MFLTCGVTSRVPASLIRVTAAISRSCGQRMLRQTSIAKVMRRRWGWGLRPEHEGGEEPFCFCVWVRGQPCVHRARLDDRTTRRRQPPEPASDVLLARRPRAWLLSADLNHGREGPLDALSTASAGRCNRGGGRPPTAATALPAAAKYAIAGIGKKATAIDFAAALQRTLFFQVGVFVLSFLLMLALPRMRRAEPAVAQASGELAAQPVLMRATDHD